MNITYTGRKTQKKEFLVMLAKWFSRKLNLDKYRKTLTFVSKSEIDFDPTGINGATYCDGNSIYVYINARISIQDTIIAVAHEMVHVGQYARGQLRTVFKRGIPARTWMGKRVSNKVEYLELPWEKQAFGRQGILAWEFCMMLSK